MLSQLTNTFFPLCSLVLSIFLAILFYSKRNFYNIETKIYSNLIIIGLFESFLYVFICLVGDFIFSDRTYWFFYILNKILCIVYIAWMTHMTYYIYAVCKKNDKSNRKVRNYMIIFDIIISIIIVFSPMELMLDRTKYISNATGLTIEILYIVCSLYFAVMIFTILKNIKNKELKGKFIPFYVLILFFTVSFIIRLYDPYFNITSNIFSFVLLIMYHTIENPDLKMIDELQKNKSLVETSMEDKSLFLFKMSQDIKEPIKNISTLTKEYNINELTKEEISENYRMIESNINNLNFIVNSVINVSDIDISKVKVVNTTYDVNNLFESIKKQAENSLKEKQDIEFRYDISNAIPKELYGDYIKLKQIITTILNNSIKYTNKGLIELDVDAITRYDLCRLIIKISDTGIGMSLDQINDILRNNYEFEEDEYEKLDNLHLNLEMAVKLIRILGGNINIKSDIDHGTEITIILDQKVKLEEKSETTKNLSKYSNTLFKTKVLIVDDNSEELNKIVKILSKSDISTNIAMYGKECIDKIKSGEKYKIILMNDEMKPDNALPTLEELKKIKKFNIPVIIMINKEKEFIKEHYIKDGFTDYILKDKMDKELERIINKYL